MLLFVICFFVILVTVTGIYEMVIRLKRKIKKKSSTNKMPLTGIDVHERDFVKRMQDYII